MNLTTSRWVHMLQTVLILAACLTPLKSEATQTSAKNVRNIALVLFHGEGGVERSFRETLAGSGFDIRYSAYDAAGSIAALGKNLEGLDAPHYDIVYTSGVPATEAALQLIKERPIVFAIDEPLSGSSLIKSGSSSPNATGVLGQVPPESALAPLSLIVKLRRVGLMNFHPAGISTGLDLEKTQRRFGIKITDLSVSPLDSVPAVLKRVAAAKVEAVLWSPATVEAGRAEAIMAGLNKRGIPSIAVTGESVKGNLALLSLRPDSELLGRRAAQNALALLRGSRPDQVPWQSVGTTLMTVDLKVADQLGINLPLQVMALANPRAPQLAGSPPSPLSSVSSAELLVMLRALVCVVMIVTVGVVIGRWDDWLHQQALIKLIDCIFLPCLVFFALQRHKLNLGEFVYMGAAITVVIAALGVIALFTNGPKALQRERLIATVAMTSGTVLLPLSYLLFGHEGVAKAVCFHLLALFLYHAFGSIAGSTHLTLRQFLKVPSLYVALIAIAAGTAPVEVPGGLQEFVRLLEKGVEMAGMGAIPLLLLSFGYPLGQLRFSTISLGLARGWMRLVVSPVLALSLVLLLRSWWWPPSGPLLPSLGLRTSEAIFILGASMPTSHYALRLGIPGRYPNGDGDSGTILLTALGAVFTVGAVLFLIAAFVLRGGGLS